MRADASRVALLVEREAASLLAYFERRIDIREDAADLLGDTLLVLWRRVAAVPSADEDARRWLFGVARKVLSGYRRGRLRRGALAERLRGELSVASSESDPVAESVRVAVRALPERDRELVGLIHWEGFGLHEVAQILGISAGTARMRYMRARARLAQDLVAFGRSVDPLHSSHRAVE
jgi:RNA polymerase sigma-70 factor (ECF subfamily)